MKCWTGCGGDIQILRITKKETAIFPTHPSGEPRVPPETRAELERLVEAQKNSKDCFVKYKCSFHSMEAVKVTELPIREPVQM